MGEGEGSDAGLVDLVRMKDSALCGAHCVMFTATSLVFMQLPLRLSSLETRSALQNTTAINFESLISKIM